MTLTHILWFTLLRQVVGSRCSAAVSKGERCLHHPIRQQAPLRLGACSAVVRRTNVTSRIRLRAGSSTDVQAMAVRFRRFQVGSHLPHNRLRRRPVAHVVALPLRHLQFASGSCECHVRAWALHVTFACCQNEPPDARERPGLQASRALLRV